MNLNSPPYNFPPMAFFCFVSSDPQEDSSVETIEISTKNLAGSFDQNYLILKNENALIGLFQGMFEGNILTFNPGWDERGQNIKKFDDIRIIEQQLKSKGVKIDLGIDSTSTGPASIMLTDPDGNIILFDQHR
jgi:hypothetical protein